MAIRIPWDRYEVALLFSTYERVANGADLGKEASNLSETLRTLATLRGNSINETYRNVSGMKMQLANVQYLFTDGQKGLSGASAMIRQMYDLYKSKPEDYQTVLKEAIRLTCLNASVEDAFFTYAKEHIGLSHSMMAEYLKKAADFCHLKQPLLGMTDVKAVRNVQQKVAEGKLLRFRYGKDAQTIRTLTHLYYTFIKSYRVPQKELPLQKRLTEGNTMSTLDASSDATAIEIEVGSVNQTVAIAENTSESNVVVQSKDSTEEWMNDRLFVEWNKDNSCLFTKPVSYTYRGTLYNAKSWNRLYVEVCGLLFADHREDFMGIMNGDIPGGSALAFADEQNCSRMRAPKSFAPGYYLESNLDATSIVRKLCGLHQLFGITDELKIEYRTVKGYRPAKEAAAYLEDQQMKSEKEDASPWTEYEAVLKHAFPKGFQKESGLDMKKLRKRWAEIHGKELKDSDETVRIQLAAHCVDTGKRWYLAELLLSDEDRQTVLRYIDCVLGSGKRVLYYSSIYAVLEHQLESTVLTEDLLVSYLLATCQNRYILREHYLTNDCNAQVCLSEEIKDVMQAYGRPIHTDELKRALHHLPSDRVERELHIDSEFIMDAVHMYFHESMAELADQELDQIAAFIQDELDDQGYMIGNWIQQKLAQLYPETAERLSFLTPLGVRGAVAYKLQDRFTFSGPVITPKGKAMNMIDVFSMFCQHHAPFSLSELEGFAKECDSPIYWDTVHMNCARVSEEEFVATGAVHWDIPHVDAAIALQCPGKYASMKGIQYFDAFPYVGYSWNSYLLEQYVATVSKDFLLMHSSYAKNNTSGVIVRWNAGFGSFDEVLADILANAPVDLEKDPCLGYLADAGYITRRKLSNISEIITRAKMLRSQKG